jgi:hypothetical protein
LTFKKMENVLGVRVDLVAPHGHRLQLVDCVMRDLLPAREARRQARRRRHSGAIDDTTDALGDISFETFLAETIFRKAVVRDFQVLGEAATNISSDIRRLRARNPVAQYRDDAQSLDSRLLSHRARYRLLDGEARFAPGQAPTTRSPHAAR